MDEPSNSFVRRAAPLDSRNAGPRSRGIFRSRPPAVRLGGSRDSGECRYRDGPLDEGR